MKNRTRSQVIIEMNHLDNANRFTKVLQKFCEFANMGGDAKLMIDGCDGVKDCGFVAHDLMVDDVKHVITEPNMRPTPTPATKAAKKKMTKGAEEFEAFKKKLTEAYVSDKIQDGKPHWVSKYAGNMPQGFLSKQELFFWNHLLSKPLPDSAARILELEAENLRLTKAVKDAGFEDNGGEAIKPPVNKAYGELYQAKLELEENLLHRNGSGDTTCGFCGFKWDKEEHESCGIADITVCESCHDDHSGWISDLESSAFDAEELKRQVELLEAHTSRHEHREAALKRAYRDLDVAKLAIGEMVLHKRAADSASKDEMERGKV